MATNAQTPYSALLGWGVAYLVTLAAFAGLLSIDAPLPVGILFALLVVLVLGRLSAADRAVTSRKSHSVMALLYAVAVGIAAAGIAASTSGGLADQWGFAALGALLYAATRTIDRLRRAVAGCGRLRLGLLVVVAIGLVLVVLPATNLRLVGAALVAAGGVLSVQVWSASYPQVLRNHRLRTAAVGGGVLFLLALGLWIWNADSTITFVVVGVVLAVTGILITSNDSSILLVVLLFAAVWSTVPRDATLPVGQLPASNEPYFAVLGDSYISGEGTDRFFVGTNERHGGPGSECRRSPSAWPMLLNPPGTFDAGDVIGVPERVENRACSGAVTADIRRASEMDGRSEPEQLDDLERAMATHGDPQFVLVGIGGNDAQFSDIGVACALPGDCDDFLDEIKKVRLDSVGAEVGRTLAEVRIAVGADVPVVAVPYPEPLHLGDGCRGVLLSQGDIEAINDFASALDELIEEAATRVGALYMDSMESALANTATQLCEPNGPSGLNFADLNPKGGSLWSALSPTNWGHNFVHPNDGGHRALQAAALDWLDLNPCVLLGACDLDPINDEVRALASEEVDGLADRTHDWKAAVAGSLPYGTVALTLLVLSSWLLITGAVSWRGVEGDRGVSLLERASTLPRSGDVPSPNPEE